MSIGANKRHIYQGNILQCSPRHPLVTRALADAMGTSPRKLVQRYLRFCEFLWQELSHSFKIIPFSFIRFVLKMVFWYRVICTWCHDSKETLPIVSELSACPKIGCAIPRFVATLAATLRHSVGIEMISIYGWPTTSDRFRGAKCPAERLERPGLQRSGTRNSLLSEETYHGTIDLTGHVSSSVASRGVDFQPEGEQLALEHPHPARHQRPRSRPSSAPSLRHSQTPTQLGVAEVKEWMKSGKSPWHPRKDARSVVNYKSSAHSGATKRYVVRTDNPMEALPGGFADDDFGFHYVEPEVADAPLARRRETSEARPNIGGSVEMKDLVTSHDDLDALHVATALHRLARLGGRGLAASAAVAALLKRLEDGADGAAQAQVSLLWAAARLTLGGPWLSRLTKALEVSDLSGAPGDAALHRELQRRQKALGPGGTSALDTILLADALAKLQIRDEPLFSSLAAALLKHLELKQLGVRELRHAASAFGQMGFVDKQLMAKMMAWLQTRLDDCSSNDLSALAFSFSRCVPAVPSGRAFFAALPPQLTGRLQRGEVLPQEAAVFLVSFSQAHLLDEHVESLMRLAPLIEKSPNTLNGHWMALLVPSISHFAKASLMEVLANRSSQLSATLSPRQLARLAIGFGQGQLQSPKLWQSLTKEAMSKSGSFSAPDTLRLLAGLDAANVNDRNWAIVAKLRDVAWGFQ
eukprot:s41_g3.t1